MKSKPISFAGTLLLLFLFHFSQAQFGTFASAVWVTDCNQSSFYNTTGAPADLIGPSGNVFQGMNFGVHTQNSGSLLLRGGSVKTFKNPASSNVCTVQMYYRVYLQSGVPGAFTPIDLPLVDNCNVPAGQFPSGGPCSDGDQKWQRVIPLGATTPYAPINLTSFAPGNYVVDIYFVANGNQSSTSGCSDAVTLDNGGAYYKAFFSIQNPTLSSTNPSTCNGTEGSFTISGLQPGATYSVSYLDNGNPVAASNYTADGSGQVTITGLDAGLYSNISIIINGCTTNLNTGVILSNPLIVPSFSTIDPFCAGTTAPTLPAVSNNGIPGTWSPAVISNTASGTYTFTPSAGQCGLPTSINVTVIPLETPTFSFGTSVSICNGAFAPLLPTISQEGYTGTWSPATVSNTTSGTYTFTPDAGQCAGPATLTVTVNPIVSPAFAFGSTLTICAGDAVPSLPATSTNGISGTWSPPAVDNFSTIPYTFTPNPGECATPFVFTVTVNPVVTPTFSFSNNQTICINGTVPTLPGTSDNGVTGTWSPATVSNTSSGTYTFTPTSGQCATNFVLNVTIQPLTTPTFSFGTNQTLCAGSTVPVLPGTSTNGITGSWSPAVVDNNNSGTYTFTPDAGQCATGTTLTVTINPNQTPTFLFGNALSICAGDTPPVLTTTSTNGITGTWSPLSINNTSSATYTFTPTAGLCAVQTTLTVTVNPVLTPVFAFGSSQTICTGGAVPTLPGSSDNGVTGTWSPATVSNTSSGSYTFTPDAGQCANPFVFNVTISPLTTPNFAFGNSLTICAGGSVPILSASSTNGITGTWSPALVDNNNSGTYTFTPDAGQCASNTTFTVTVNPNITPTFTFGTSLTICAGESVPSLPATSSNGITGIWSPATVSNTTSDTYTFTPNSGQCAVTAVFTVTVNPIVTPTFPFASSLNLCAGGTAPTLPGTSNNGITGTWSPASIDNNNSGTYTFTPTAGQCANPFVLNVIIDPNITPNFVFGTTLTICAGGTVPALPATSTNGISGIWSPASVDDNNSGTYTFTPNAGQCALPATFTVTVNPILTPTFDFGNNLALCIGATAPALPGTSNNGVTGTWSPATIDNNNSGTYTFTPTAGQCANPFTLNVTVDPNINPIFSIGTSLTICSGGAVPGLPTTSDNGITGSWSPASIDNTSSGTYTFTPDAGQCAAGYTYSVTVNPNTTPVFSFGTSLSICTGAMVPSLPATSDNGITGTWSPAVVDNINSGTYTFTPTAGLCALPTSLTVTVNPILTPTFDFGTSITLCENATAPVLVTTSNNGISGTWSPATINTTASGTYTFTPAAGECGTSATLTVTITPNTDPVFSFGSSLTLCAGGTVPVLPNSSDNGINGTWNPATVSNSNSGTYTFTPATGVCANPFVYTVTVNPIVAPTFSFGTSQSICVGGTVPTLPTTSSNGITGTWSPAVVDNNNSGTYTFTPTAGLCASTATFTMQVNPIPVLAARADTVVYDGALVPAFNFSSTPAGTIAWSNNNTAIGLGASGNGNTPPFTATNTGNTPISGTITLTPSINGCTGQTRTFTVTVNPLDKDVFVPNVFSPNGDGKNEVLYVYGNYINKVEMRIFNQWGQQIAEIKDKTQGWDGRHKGTPQPVGVYVYNLRAELADGRIVNLKGSITLVR